MLLRRPHDLAGLFREGRARAGWSQTELAELIGVSRQWISLVENGKTSGEFDLVLGALQALGYRVNVEALDLPSPEQRTTPELPETTVHGPTQRTPLTRHGEPLGRRRARRTKRDGHG